MPLLASCLAASNMRTQEASEACEKLHSFFFFTMWDLIFCRCVNKGLGPLAHPALADSVTNCDHL